MPTIGNIDPQTEFLVCRGIPMGPDYANTLTFDSKEAQLAFYRAKAKFTLTNQTYQRVTSNTCRLMLNAESVFDCNYIAFCNHGFGKPGQYSTQRLVQVGVDPETQEPIMMAHYPEAWDAYGGISTPEADKWWYAFITDITYVSNACVEITYAIDVMQTYMFDYSLPSTYVERMHVDASMDLLYASRTQEDFDLGPLYTTDFSMCNILSPTLEGSEQIWKFMLLGGDNSKNDESGLPTGAIDLDAHLIGNFPTLLSQIDFEGAPASSHSNLNRLAHTIEEYITNGKVNNIVGVYAVPGCMEVPEGNSYTNFEMQTLNYNPTFDKSEETLLTFTDFQNNEPVSYRAVNGKLMQYPFNRIVVSNFADQHVELRYELFNRLGRTGPTFRLFYTLLPEPTITIVPHDYGEGGIIGGEIPINSILALDLNHPVTIGSFPRVAFEGSAYSTWFAQNIASGSQPTRALAQAMGSAATALAAASLFTGGASTPLAAAAGASSRAIAGAAIAGGTSLFASGANAYADSLKAKASPDPIVSPNQSPNAIWANGVVGFGIYRQSISRTQAYKIDTYFSHYGYAIQYATYPIGYRQDGVYRAGIRPLWNYLKCPGVVIQADAPINAAHKAIIASNYANGITFWHVHGNSTDVSFVGVYTDDSMKANHAAFE